jgi:hypothetical protein
MLWLLNGEFDMQGNKSATFSIILGTPKYLPEKNKIHSNVSQDGNSAKRSFSLDIE